MGGRRDELGIRGFVFVFVLVFVFVFVFVS